MKLIHDGGKHNKFWSYDIDDTTHDVTIRWGRLGTNGQSKIYKFTSHWYAQDFADKKARGKRRKGYAEMENDAFDLKQMQAELVGSGCKIEELAFVKHVPNTNTYNIVVGAEALADPSYIPLIYCSLYLTGKRGNRCLLIDPEKVYSCWQVGVLESRASSRYKTASFNLQDVEEIGDDADAEMKKIRDKAPALVSALIR